MGPREPETGPVHQTKPEVSDVNRPGERDAKGQRVREASGLHSQPINHHFRERSGGRNACSTAL